MKKKFTILIAAIAAILMMAQPEKVLAQTKDAATTTYVFSSAKWKANIGTTAADWTSKKDGNALTSGQGIQVTTGASGACGNSDISYSNVSKITVTYCTNNKSGAGSISWYNVSSTTANAQSGTLVGTQNISAPSSGGTTLRTFDIEPSSSQTGFIQLYVTCSTNSVYVYSVEITYSSGPTQLAAPTNFSATAGNAQATFSWTAVEQASSYTILAKNGDTWDNTTVLFDNVSLIDGQYVGTGLDNGTTYVCKVRANGDGTNYSNSALSETTATFTPTNAQQYTVSIAEGIIGGTVTALPTSATEGTTITLTATPADGYKFNNNVENWSITPTTTITPVASTNTATFSMPGANVTAVAATFTPYTVTLQAGTGCTIGSTSSSTASWDVTQNSGNLPTATSPCDEKWVFEGWSTTNQTTQTETKPTLVSTAYVPTSDNITLYAVYKKTEEGPDPVAFSSGSTGNYAIVSEVISEKYYALPTSPTVSSGKIAGGEITVSTKGGVNYIETSNASGYTWIIASATYGYTISDGSKYVYHKNGGASSTDLAYGTGTDYTWNFVQDGNTNYYKITARNGSTVSGRGMFFSGTSLGGYALSNWGNTGYYKTMILPIVDGTKIYYISTPDCKEQVATPVITLAAGSYTSDQITTITCETTDATIYYTTDGTDPTDASTEYTGAITIDRSMTIKAIAIHEDYSNSNIASATYVLPRVFANIAAFKAEFSTNSSEIVKITGPLTTVYHNGKNLYVQDNTGSLLVYDDDTHVTRIYENGQTVSNIYGKYAKYNNLIEFIPDRDFPSPEEGTAVEPTDIASLTSGDYSTYDAKLVRLSNMMFTDDYTFSVGSVDNAEMDDDDYNTVVVRSRFKTLDGDIHETDMANVVGFVGINNATIQLYPRDNNDIQMIMSTMNVTGSTIVDFDAVIEASKSIVVKDGGILTISGTLTNLGDETNLIIEDGGQLICNNPVAATVKKNITNASAKAGEKWYAISSSVHDDGETYETIDNVTNLTSGTYDMFCYDEASNTWLNQKPSTTPLAAGFSTMMRGRGYIYRNTADKELAFTGETNVGTVEYGDGENYYLGWSCKEEKLIGFNLVGNPYPHKIYKGVAFATTSGTTTDTLVTGYYALEGDGSWTAKTNSDAIDVNQAILVEATEYANGKKLQFKDRTTAPNAKSNNDNIMFTVENSAYSDIAYAWFDNGNGLKKIEHRNANIPMLYINQDGTDYAIAMMSDTTKSFGLNFKAKTMGTYTLSYKAEGNFDYLHVIDRLTGEDVDMLMDGKYSFVGSPQDNAGRFIVKLGYDNGSSTGSETFVYQNGNDIIVDGEGTLEVFDVTGRKVMTTDINGVETINGLNTGVYIFRVIGETLRTQKIVVR